MSVQEAEPSTTAPIVSLLDATGTIVWVNEAWRAFERRNGQSAAYHPVGQDYLEVAERAGDGAADRVVAGLDAILNGDRSAFTAPYACHSPAENRWFRVYASRMTIDGDGYCLVTHERTAAPTPLDDTPGGTGTDSGPSGTDPGRIDELVSHPISADEPAVDALLAAFERLGVDLQRRETTLQDWVDTDAVDRLSRSDADLQLTFTAWNYVVVLSQDRVLIYAPAAEP